MSSTKIGIAVVLLLASLTGCGGGSGNGGGGRYVVADAGPVESASPGYQAVAGPNSAGQLVGPTLGLGCGDGGALNGCYGESPYVYTPGHATRTVQQKGTLQGINNKDDVIGFGPDGMSYLVQGGNTTSLGSSTQAFSLNDSAQVVGSYLPPGPFAIHAFLWQAGHLTDLGGLPGFNGAEARGINNVGHIVGDSDGPGGIHAAYWHDGTVADLGAGLGESEADAINNAGEIVGRVTHPDGTHAAAWHNGVALDLGKGAAFGLDDSGVAVGIVPNTGGKSGYHAAMWSGARETDLNTLIDPGSGWVLESASGINSKGQIAGSGQHNGVPRAFLLTPR